jgi:hypothetical protein
MVSKKYKGKDASEWARWATESRPGTSQHKEFFNNMRMAQGKKKKF